MFVLKGCPRCRGDLARDHDDELTCIQCGRALGRSQRAALFVVLQGQQPFRESRVWDRVVQQSA
jgi:hypothetical protein